MYALPGYMRPPSYSRNVRPRSYIRGRLAKSRASLDASPPLVPPKARVIRTRARDTEDEPTPSPEPAPEPSDSKEEHKPDDSDDNPDDE